MSEVFLVQAKRIPQAKSGGLLQNIEEPYLISGLLRTLMLESGIPLEKLDEVILGNVGNPMAYPNLSRVATLLAGLPQKTSAYTIHRNCASGMEALAQAFLKIKSGSAQVLLAGGVESMSRLPLLFSRDFQNWFVNFYRSKSLLQKAQVLSHFRLRLLKPIVALECGLRDPVCGLNMGETAELLAREFRITRTQQDEFALHSHEKALAARERFQDEIIPIMADRQKLVTEDQGPRAGSSLEKLAKLKPYFEPKTGTVTVGNSCPITDGASAALLVSEEAVKKYRLEPLARIVGTAFYGLEPERMGLGPVLATHQVLQQTGLNLEQMDLVEINEAFAAQVLACLQSFKEKKEARRLGLPAQGEVPLEKLNVNGGAIALGHPIGSTGCRLVVSLAHELKRRKSQYGLATLCIGGGQGGALVMENLRRT